MWNSQIVDVAKNHDMKKSLDQKIDFARNLP